MPTPLPAVSTGVRRRSVTALFAGVAALGTGSVAAAATGTIFVSDSAGESWSGLPNAAAVLGTALGSVWLGVLMGRRGRRSALRLIYGLSTLGALVSFLAAAGSVLVGLLAGMVLLGLGNSAANLSRYVAADLYPEGRKGFGLSVIVWAGTVGALAGPGLIAPAASLAGHLGLPELSGAFLVAAVLSAVATAATTLLPARAAAPDQAGRPPLTLAYARASLRRPEVLTPLSAMVAAHVAMVAVMTMTPLQIHQLGHGLDLVGVVLSVHLVGMFLLAPLSGLFADRWGGASAIRVGLGVIGVAALLAILFPGAATSGMPAALFLLGYGWNLVFVSSSTMLSSQLSESDRAQVQGLVDALVWGASAAGSLVAGQLFGLGGYALVAAAAGSVVAVPLLLLGRTRGPAVSTVDGADAGSTDARVPVEAGALSSAYERDGDGVR